jgi:4-alpha-glucanotransferase
MQQLCHTTTAGRQLAGLQQQQRPACCSLRPRRQHTQHAAAAAAAAPRNSRSRTAVARADAAKQQQPSQPQPQQPSLGSRLSAAYGDESNMPDWHKGRRAGVILHPTSLPGPNGIGELGAEAFRFVDWLADAGMQCWQVRGIQGLHATQEGRGAV